jgi:hypothetical protein
MMVRWVPSSYCRMRTDNWLVNLLGGKVEGVVDCVTKPFRVKDLLARVHLQVQLGKRRIKLEEEFEVRSRELQILTDLSPVSFSFHLNVVDEFMPCFFVGRNFPYGRKWEVSRYAFNGRLLC